MTDDTEQPITVNFMIAGTQKGGTTALHAFLSEHPDICMAWNKEAHFFDQDEFFTDGTPPYDEYATAFSHYDDQKLVGEATPGYMFAPHIAPRLQQYNPALKLILVLRHPVERAFSHYNMMVKAENEALSFAEALQAEEARLTEAQGNFQLGSPFWLFSYASRSFYMRQINNLLRYFPREQILLLRNEEVLHEHDATLRRVYDFLGVDPVISPHERIFSLAYKPMLPQDRAHLLEVFAQDTEELAKFTGWDLSDWRK